MKKINQRKITLFVLFLYTLGILTFGNIFDDTLNIREEGTLIINEPNDETSFILGIDYLPGIDPHSSNGYEFSAVIDQVVETLLAYNLSDPELSIIPRLAVSKGIWSGDGLSYTIQLKTGVKFHDGTNFDASAVKWSFDRLAYFMNISGSLPPTQNTPYFDYIYRWDDGTPIINRTEVLNTDLIKFVLNQPYGAFEGLLSISSSGILSPTSTSATEYIEYLTDDLVGTGPFVYDGYFNYYNDGEINFHAFEEYHQGITNITHLKYSIIHDSLALNNAILSGDIDAIYNPLSSMLDTFTSDPSITVEKGNSSTTYFLIMNNEIISKPIRQAISYAFDYSYFIDEIFQGEGYRLKSPIPEEMMYANWSFNNPNTDIIEARTRLVDAGICSFDIFDDQVWLNAALNNPIATYTFTRFAGSLISQLTAELVTTNLEQIGIKIDTIILNWGEFIDRLETDPNSMHLYYFGYIPDYNDPLCYINTHFSQQSESNYAQVNDPYLELLMEQGLLETDSSLREQIYDEIQQYLVEDLMPYAFCLVQPHYLVYNINVEGLHINPLKKIWFYDVTSKIDRPWSDYIPPIINIVYSDNNLEHGVDNLYIEALVSDNVQLNLPVIIDFYYPNGTIIDSVDMNWASGDLFYIDWNTNSLPALYGYYFRIYASDVSDNGKYEGDYFNIIAPGPEYIETNPIYIDDTSSNNWAWAATQEWCTGSGASNDPYIIENISIDGLGTQNCIDIRYSSKHFIIRNSFLTNSGIGNAGINLYSVDNGKITGCISTANYHGIFLQRGDYNSISYNDVFDNTHDGITLESFHNYCTITGNVAVNNFQHGIVLRQECLYNNITENIAINHVYSGMLIQGDSNYNTITNNMVSNNEYGGIWIYHSDNNDILENIFSNNNEHGIMVEGSINNRIEQNEIEGNSVDGISFKSWDYVDEWNIGNIVIGNNISNNLGIGLKIDDYSMDTLIYLNNFVDNSIQSQDDGTNNQWDNGAIGNYWNDYTGSDLNDDGIGDTPYIISGTSGSLDNFPIMGIDHEEPPEYYILSPIKIDNLGHGDYTWVQAVNEEWCSGAGTISDPYIIDGVSINANGNGRCLTIENSNEYFIIRNSKFYNSGLGEWDSAVFLNHTYNGILEHNNISNNNGHGILLVASEYNWITENNISDNGRYGAYLYGSDYNYLGKNSIRNSDYGVYVYDSDHGIIVYNTIEENNFGLYLNEFCSWHNFSFNNFLSNTWNGIISEGIYSNFFLANNILGSDIGIFLNTFNNSIISNIISECGISAVDDSGVNSQNEWYGNYYSDYEGVDADDNGIGDFPYLIPGTTGSIDNYPIWDDGPGVPEDYWTISPFIIDEEGYGDYTWSQVVNEEWCSGLGTLNDPYVINNLIIDCEGYDYGIVIRNSNVYFIIKNCKIFNAGLGSAYYEDIGDAIKLENTSNGILIDNNCSTNGYSGISLSFCSNLTITGNYLSYNNWTGLQMNYCNISAIQSNIMEYNEYSGINAILSFKNIFTENILDYNFRAGILVHGFNNSFRNNLFKGCGLLIYPDIIHQLREYDIDTSNLIDGKPIYFYKNRIGLSNIDFINPGQIMLYNCKDIILNNIEISSGSIGIYLVQCNNFLISDSQFSNLSFPFYLYMSNETTILQNDISNCEIGISLYFDCFNTQIIENNISNSNIGIAIEYFVNDTIVMGNRIENMMEFGIHLYESSSNLIYNNIFIQNAIHAFTDEGTDNQWDNGLIGNYWDDYDGIDANDDGIGDTPYLIGGWPENVDNFPIWDDGPEVPPGYWILSPFTIDEFGYGDYTWAQVVLEEWCSGTGTASDPYIIQNVRMDCTGSATGIYIMNSNVNFIIKNCTIYNVGLPDYYAGEAIRLENVNNSIITNNTCYDVIFNGIALYNSHFNVISENIIFNCENIGIMVELSSNITLINNNLENNPYGIVLMVSDNINLYDNIVKTGEMGLYASTSIGCRVLGNRFENHTLMGIYLATESSNWIIYNNYFIDNLYHTYVDSGTGNSWDNGITGNYWDDYTGSDLDDDGIGDTPYVIFGVLGNIDNYPIWDDGPEGPAGYWILSPFTIDEFGYGDYTWAQAVMEEWCSGTGTASDPYIIQNIRMDCTGSETGIYIMNSDVNFIIRNCTVYNSGGLYSYIGGAITLENVINGIITNNTCFNNSYSGIALYNSHLNEISDNLVKNNPNFGITLELSDNNNVLHNELRYNMQGIHLASFTNKISGNLLVGDGIYVEPEFMPSYTSEDIDTSNLLNGKPVYFYANEIGLDPDDFLDAGEILLYNCNNSNISGLYFEDCFLGIYLVNCYNNTVEDVSFKNTIAGLWIIESHNNSFLSNSFDGYNVAIYLVYSNFTNIYGNNIENGQFGIYAYYSSFTKIVNNLFKNHTTFGIYIFMESYNSVIYYNFFIDNPLHALDDSTTSSWDNGTIGNYWDDYTGSDLDDDGIGDTPYYVPGYFGNVDNYPIWDDGFEPNYWVLSPFIIDDQGNGDYTWYEASLEDWCIGSGTENDPYILKNIVIYGDQDTNGLEIRNSNSYFIIRNCTINNSGTSWNYGGIVLTNVLNGQILDCILVNNFNSIWIRNSQFINISGNEVNGNAYGIKLQNSDYNTIINNYVENCHDAIVIEGISNFVSVNTLVNNDQAGISISGFQNIISGNILESCGILTVETSHFIDTSNLVNGKPVYYYVDQIGLNPNDFINAGQVILANCQNIFISNLEISDVTRGINLINCNSVTIMNCIISNNYLQGILLRTSSSNTINDNTFINNGDDGILLSGSCHGNNIISNIFIGGGIWSYGGCDNNIIFDNYFENDGIDFSSGNFNIISNNEFRSVYYALKLSHGSNNIFSDNIIRDNTNPNPVATIFLRDTSHDNLLYNNSFINNLVHARDDGSNNQWDNGLLGNYWDDYTGVDLNDDGIGDSPYTIPGSAGAIDNYPIWDDGIDDYFPPITKINLEGVLGTNGWYVSEILVNFTAEDDAAGVAYTEYSFNDGDWFVYNSPFLYDQQGFTTIYYRSIDNSGKVETSKSIQVKIDTLEPESSISLTGTLGQDDWYISDVFATISVMDSISGIDLLEYSFDGLSWILYSQPIEINNRGTTILYWRVFDKAGNLALFNKTIKIDDVAPVSDYSLDGTMGLNDWYTSEIILTLNTTDDYAGVQATEYSFNGIDWIDYVSPVSILDQGDITVYYRSIDNAGNVETDNIISFKIDSVKPISSIELEGILGDNGWYISEVNVTLFAEDDTSNIFEVQYSPDGVNWNVYSTSFTIINEGITELFYRSLDLAGNYEIVQVHLIKIDKTLPTTNINLLGTIGNDNWYISNVQITFDSSDSYSGVFGTYYSLDEINWNLYTGPFDILTEGEITIYYYSIDQAGFIEPSQITSFKIDNTSPTTVINLSGILGLNNWYNSEVLVSLDASDSLSGLNYIEYSLDREIWNTYTTPFILDIEGFTGLNYRSVDVAGKIEEIKIEHIQIDISAPETMIDIYGTLGTNNWYLSDVVITFSATDAYSGINYTEYSFDQLSWYTYTESINIIDQGITAIYYRSVDISGIFETVNNLSIKIDKLSEFPQFSYWNITWGGNENYVCMGMEIDSSNNIFVAGYITSYYDSDLFLIKFDSSGALQWYRTWNTNNYDWHNDWKEKIGITIDSQDNIYLVGTARWGSGLHYEACLLKYDNSGNLLWVRTWGGDYREQGYGIALDSSEDVYIVGSSFSFTTPPKGFLVKYDKDGNFQWQQFGGGGHWFYVTVDSADNIYCYGAGLIKYDKFGNVLWSTHSPSAEIGGIGLDSDGNIYLGGHTKYFTNPSRTHMILLKYDSSGAIQWTRSWNTDKEDLCYDIAVDITDNIYLIGETGGIDTAEYDIIIVKYDSDGIQQYNLTSDYNGTSRILLSSIIVDSKDNLYIAGSLKMNDGLYDVWIQKIGQKVFFPKTLINLHGTLGSNGWFTSEVSIILDAYEDLSGINRTEYSFNGENWITYTDSVIITDEGIIDIYYRSIDNAGNIEMISMKEIKIDRTNPLTNIEIDGEIGPWGWFTDSVTISLEGLDSTSGIDRIEFSNDGIYWATYYNPIIISWEGSTSFYYRSIDNAGNIGVANFEDIEISHSILLIDDEGHLGFTWLEALNAGWCTGVGTLTDPYIIENYNFPENDGYIIEIRNSDVYFIIRNCESLGFDYGIRLENVDNALIRDNLIYGVSTEFCKNINIKNNIFESGQLYIFYTNSSILSGNIFNQAISESILLTECFFNEISNNILNGVEGGEGIRAEGPNNYNSFINNTISNFDIGFFMEGECNYNTISYNNVSYNTEVGIYLDACNDNLISENLISDKGIYIERGNNNIISKNILSGISFYGINLNFCKDSLIVENFIENHDLYGIWLYECIDIEVSNNEIRAYSDYGIQLEYCDSLFILNNKIHYGESGGIILDNSNNSLIKGNYMNHDYGEGIVLWKSNNNIIVSNIILESEGIVLTSCSDNFISRNIITTGLEIGEYWFVGIFVEGGNCNIIRGNQISSLGTGIYINNYNEIDAGFNIISENLIINNTRGINIEIYSENNYIYNNIFIDNTEFNALDDGINNFWDNGTIGNYWDDYPGVDADDDGIGDTPYNITGSAGSLDNFPIWDDDQDIFPPSRYLDIIIEILVNLEIPEDAQQYIDNAILFLTQAKEKFESGMIYEAFDKIKDSIEFLMIAGDTGANTQEIIDSVVFLVQYIVDFVYEKVLEITSEDNKFIIRAVNDYDIALEMITVEEYGEAVKFFKFSYRNIMKAKGVFIETFVSDLSDRLSEIEELMAGDISNEAKNLLLQIENKLLLAIEKANNSLTASSIYQLKDVVQDLLDLGDLGIDTIDIIESIMSNVDDFVYLQILDAESILMGESNRHIDKAWTYYNKAQDLWNDGKYEFALSYFAKAIEKVNDALP